MLTDYLVPLTIVLAVAALVCVGSAVFTWRRVSAAGAEAAQLAVVVDERAAALPTRLSSARASLAEQGAAAEHVAWTLKHIDEQLATFTVDMARRRVALDHFRMTLDSSRGSVERLKSSGRLIMRAIELRRAFLR